MTNKIIIKEVRSGQTQLLKTVTPGAGMSGQALVLKAAPGSWYQLSDVVTYTGPKKVLTKRVGKDLHVSLPGGDVDMSDIVIEGYFDAPGTKLQGYNPQGELLSYDTAGLSSAQVPPATPSDSATSNAPGPAPAKPTALQLGEPANSFLGISTGFLGELTPVQMALGGGGALAALSAIGGGSSSSSSPSSSSPSSSSPSSSSPSSSSPSSSSPSSSPSALQVLIAYTDSSTTPDSSGVKSGVTTPTLSTYTALGVKLFKSLQETAEADRVDLATAGSPITAAILNSAIDRFAGSALNKDQVQKLVDAWYRILKEADGNTTTDIDVYDDTTNDADRATELEDPTAEDYAAIGALAGSTSKSLVLLNDFVGRQSVTGVSSVTKVDALARAAENIMLQAKAATAGSSGGPAIYGTDAEWVNGLKLLGFSAVQSSMVADIKSALAATSDDGTGLDTWTELSELITPVVATHQLRNYALSSSNTAPTLQTFKDAGIRALAQLNASTAIADIDSTAVINTLGIASSQWQATLRSALDKLDLSSTTALADIRAKVQNMVNSYFRLLSEADGNSTINVDIHPETADTADNDPTSTDYTNIGATVGNASSVTLLNDFLGQATKDKVDSLDEINTLAKAAYNVMLAAGGTAGTGTMPATYAADATSSLQQKWVDGLTALGLGGVTLSNVDQLVQAIRDTANESQVDTINELGKLLSLIRMKAYDQDPAAAGAKLAAAPTLKDWGSLVDAARGLADSSRDRLDGVDYWKTTNPVNGLNALNSALDAVNAGNALTGATLQNIADAYARILNTADGDRTLKVDISALGGLGTPGLSQEDLERIGVKNGGTDGAADATGLRFLSTGDLLTSVMGSLGSAAVDSVTELDALTDIAVNIMKLADGSSGSTPYTNAQWVSNLTQLGLTGVNTGNIERIKTAMAATDASGVDTYEELQQIVSLARLNAFSEAAVGAEMPSLQDYGAIMAAQGGSYSDARSTSGDFLSAYNDAINKQNGGLNATAVEDMVTAYNLVLSLADGSRTNTPSAVPTAATYTELSFSLLTVDTTHPETLDLLNDIINGMTTSQVNSIDKLLAVDATVDKIIALAEGNDNPSVSMDLTRSEIANLGITGNGRLPTEFSGTTPIISDAEWTEFNRLVDISLAPQVDTWAEIQSLLNQAINAV